MDEVITVSLKDGTVSVDKPTLPVKHGESPKITWVPESSGITLKFVGFMDAVGKGHPIRVPQAGSQQGTISTTDVNNNPTTQPQTFKYMLWVEEGGTVYCSEDPEIVNDPQIGMGGGKP